MGKRGKPEISLRGKGRALFTELTEWVEPREPAAPMTEAQAAAPERPPVEASDLLASPIPGSPREEQEEPLPAPKTTQALRSPGLSSGAPSQVSSEDKDGFRFLAMEAARATSEAAGISNWVPPPGWRWEHAARPTQAIQVDLGAPMRALRIPGLLVPESPSSAEVSPERTPETPSEGERSVERASTTSVSHERSPAPRVRTADEAHLRQLNARIDELYRRIANGAIPDPGAAEHALAWLKQAREALLSPDGYDEAEYYYSLAQTRYAIARRLWRWSYTYGLFVFIWGIAWLGLYLWALTGGRGYSAQVVPPGYEGIWEPIMWGGLGGVCGIFYSLYWHVAIKRDFDRQYVMWYLVQPLLGSMIGMIIYMIITVGFLTIQGTPTPANPLFMYLLAFIAGFRQRFFLELIDRIVQTFTPNPRSSA